MPLIVELITWKMIVNNGRFVAYSPSECFGRFVGRLSPAVRDEVRAFVEDLGLTPYLSEGLKARDIRINDRRLSVLRECRKEVEVPSLPRAGLPHWKQSKPYFDAFLVYEQLKLF